MKRWSVVAALTLLGLAAPAGVSASDSADHEGWQRAAISPEQLMDRQRSDVARELSSSRMSSPPGIIAGERCRNGHAGIFPCKRVDLKSLVPLASMGALSANDIWGWKDGRTGRKYALVGLDNGTGFVDVTRPGKPRYLGKLPTQTESSLWRDVKVYQHYAVVVSEAQNHGMQVFDLRKLRNVRTPRTFDADAYYGGFRGAHNVAVNERSGYAYVVGSDTCRGGLHMVNIRRPLFPYFAGCYGGDRYTHDVQVVTYRGPDKRYTGREIAFAANESTLSIIDVTRKRRPKLLSKTGYRGAAYTHQGWLTGNQRYFVLGDELDELFRGNNTRTFVFDVRDLKDPSRSGTYTAPTAAIDHNQYIKRGHVYQANYRAGFRWLKAKDYATAEFRVHGFFDIYPADDRPEFNGAWGVYPYLGRNLVLINGIEQGLFVLRTRP